MKPAPSPSPWLSKWPGRTVVCIASGPSLTEADCEAVRQSGHPAIVTNTSFRMAPWSDVLFAFDAKWWREYKREVDAVFKGQRVTYSAVGESVGVETLYRQAWFTSFHNSGANAISLAVAGGAAKVVLLGFDCQKTGGKVHWHGDHPKTLGNALSLKRWPRHFAHVAKYAQSKGVMVVNASRDTALTCFERVDLAVALMDNL